TALGFAEASTLGYSSFSGFAVDSTAILIKYTRYGDANLDGSVDTIDFGYLAGNFGGSNKQWYQGDFNYDRFVDTVDFGLLAASFGKPAAALNALASSPRSANDSFASELLAAASAE